MFFLSGTGKAILDGKESRVQPGDAVVVTPGTRHNFVNDGREPLKVYEEWRPGAWLSVHPDAGTTARLD